MDKFLTAVSHNRGIPLARRRKSRLEEPPVPHPGSTPPIFFHGLNSHLTGATHLLPVCPRRSKRGEHDHALARGI